MLYWLQFRSQFVGAETQGKSGKQRVVCTFVKAETVNVHAYIQLTFATLIQHRTQTQGLVLSREGCMPVNIIKTITPPYTHFFLQHMPTKPT